MSEDALEADIGEGVDKTAHSRCLFCCVQTPKALAAHNGSTFCKDSVLSTNSTCRLPKTIRFFKNRMLKQYLAKEQDDGNITKKSPQIGFAPSAGISLFYFFVVNALSVAVVNVLAINLECGAILSCICSVAKIHRLDAC